MYMDAKFRAFVIKFNTCRIIDMQDGHFKIQDGGPVSCQYQVPMDPYNVKCMCANIGSPVVSTF